MMRSRFAIALLTSIAGLGFSGTPTSTLANDVAAPAAQTALVQNADAGVELSAQRRVGGGGFGGGGNVGRMVRPGNTGGVGNRQSRVEGTGRVSRVSRVSRVEGVGRVSRVSRVSRVDGIGRVNRISRISRVSRVSRYGRIGYIPVPVPLPSGPGIMAPAVPAVPCPVCPVQACLVAVFADPNLTGQALETRDNQPRLDLNGWQNQISSIQVRSGTWDFYPELEFRGGPALRLAPGSYGILEPQWTKQIGSFMCVR